VSSVPAAAARRITSRSAHPTQGARHRCGRFLERRIVTIPRGTGRICGLGRTVLRADRRARRPDRATGPGLQAGVQSARLTHGRPLSIRVTSVLLKSWSAVVGIAPHENHERACLDGPDPVKGLAGRGSSEQHQGFFTNVRAGVALPTPASFGRQTASRESPIKRPCEAGLLQQAGPARAAESRLVIAGPPLQGGKLHLAHRAPR